MKTIYLIRTAESTARSGESADEVNPVLSGTGEAQATALAEGFEGINFGRVFMSPLLRSWMTFKLLRLQARATTVSSLLIEEHLGKPDIYRDLVDSPDPALFPGDEDEAWFLDGPTRAELFWQRLASEPSSRTGPLPHGCYRLSWASLPSCTASEPT